MLLRFDGIWSTFFSPLSIIIGLLIAVILVGERRRVAQMLWIASLGLLLLFSSPQVAETLAASLEGQNPEASIDTIPNAEAIVVLGGAIRQPSPLHRHSSLLEPSDRILHAGINVT